MTITAPATAAAKAAIPEMPRPKKCRRVCGIPPCASFAPPGGAAGEEVLLTLDEFETLRLIDLEGLQQEQAALAMGVARTTVQAIYNAARKKVADCIVNGKALRIGGGDVEVCAGRKDCRRARCPHRCGAPCGREEKEEA